MFKRLFFAMVGLGAGVALGGYAVRKLERGRRRLTPQGLAGAAGRRASTMRDRIAAAVEAGRVAATEREAELRAAYGSGHAPAELNGASRPV
jgi:hypothetical protein